MSSALNISIGLVVLFFEKVKHAHSHTKWRKNITNSKMAAPSETNIKIRFSFSVIGILIGVSIFFIFGFHYENWNTALWGLLSGKLIAT